MKNFYIINKKEGETPLECLESFRIRKKIGKDVSMTYAGRLDPMAEGMMIVLLGEECKNKEKYLGFDKEYEFEVLFGFATDSYDILGKVVSSKNLASLSSDDKQNFEKNILRNLKFFRGKFMQKYPLYSSKTVDGKQLHEYARSGAEVEIPERQVHVKSLKFLKLRKILGQTLLQNIETKIKKVNTKNDFRQKEILKIWKQELGAKKAEDSFFCASFKACVSSGTYIRAIAQGLGEKIGTPALALKIKRTKIGKFAKIS